MPKMATSPPLSGSVRTASSPAPEPQQAEDTAELGPWKALDQQGWLENTRGALGAVLAPGVSAALAGCFERLDQAGIDFQLTRLFFFKFDSDSPRETFNYAKKRRPDELNLQAKLPGGKTMKVDNLKALMALDLIHGGGTAPDQRSAAEAAAFRSLDQQGWRFIPKQEEAVSTAEAFYRSGQEPMNIHVEAPDGKFVNLLYRRDDALHLNYLMGDGQDHGMAEPEFAAGLKALDEQGFQLGVISGGWYGDDPFDAYRATPFKVADPEKFLVRKDKATPYGNAYGKGSGALPITARRAAELAREGKLEAEFASFEQALREHGSDLSDVQLRCALRNLHGAQLKVSWGPVIKGISELSKLAPKFQTAPNVLGNYSAVLFKDCESADEVDYRLTELTRLANKGKPAEFGAAVKEAATFKLRYRQAIEEMLDDELDPELIFETDAIQVGDHLLER